MGRDCLRILQSLQLDDAKKKDPKECITALEGYFVPTRNEIYERYLFYSRDQGPNESIDQWITQLRQLIRSCNFESVSENGLLRDRIVLGTKDRAARLRMFREKKLDLQLAIDMLRASEVTTSQIRTIDKTDTSETVNFTKRHGKKSEVSKSCKFCLKVHVWGRDNCPAYSQKCSACGELNHYRGSMLCKGEKKKPDYKSRKKHNIKKQANFIDDDDSETFTDDSCFSITHTVHHVKVSGCPTVELILCDQKFNGGVSQKCIMDTGTTCNIMSIADLNKIAPKAKLRKSESKLNLYDGSYMKPLGVYSLYATHNNKMLKLRFEIVSTAVARKPLLSINTCQKFGFISINIDGSDEHRMSEKSEAQEQGVNLTQGVSPTEQFFIDFRDVFEGLGCLPGELHLQIDSTVQPVQHAPRKVPIALREPLKKKIDAMVKNGVLCKVEEPTDWISSMVVVKKPDKLRICIDPKDLNLALKRNHYPMPTIDDVLPDLANAKVFSVLDASDGFHQIKLDTESSFLTTFWTPFGRYRWMRLPFGIKPAPEEYQQRQMQALEGLSGIFVIADDILVVGYGTTQKEADANHDLNLRNLLLRCREKNLKLNKKKARIKLREVKYVGHILSPDGVKADPDKIAVIDNMSRPGNVKEIQRFLGFTQYLARFLPKLSEVSEPLRRLTHKDTEWHWESQQENAFQECKRLATTPPVLRYFDSNKPVTLQVDASLKSVGATLLQEEQPISFAARALTETEQRYACIERECLAICFGCDKFHQYLAARHDSIRVESDHKPLETIFKKSLLTSPKRLQRMRLKLQRYDLDVTYRKGSEMFISDFLSRLDLPYEQDTESKRYNVFYQQIEEINYTDYTTKFTDATLAQIQKATEMDTQLQSLKTTVLLGWPNDKHEIPTAVLQFWNFRDEITVHNGLLFKAEKLIIPQAMRPQLLNKIHASHLSVDACNRKARDVLYWPGLYSDIQQFVEKCTVCQEFGSAQPPEPLQTPEIPTRPWAKLGIDLFQHNKKDYLITVDYYSDYFEIDRLYSTTTKCITKALEKHLARFGTVDEIYSDNAPNLVSADFDIFCSTWDIKHITGFPYHSMSQGKVESAVKIAKNLMRKSKR